MKTLQIHGSSPYRIALLHGGPGAIGEMEPVGKELSKNVGALELYQTKGQIEDLIHEMHSQISEFADPPITLIGLGIIYSSLYPSFVKKIILVGCAPLEEKYTNKILQTRLNRLTEIEKRELDELVRLINQSADVNVRLLQQFARIMNKANSYKPVEITNNDSFSFNVDQYKSIWTEASILRRNGELLNYVSNVKCPIVAIHGEDDPHPYEGVFEPISRMANDFRSFLLNECGHTPWIEQLASEQFYEKLRKELRS